MEETKKIFAFEDSQVIMSGYRRLSFDITVDDAINGVYYVEADMTDYDWLAVLGLLEDCKREGLQPAIEYKGDIIDWEDAIIFADEKAAEEHIND